MEETRAAGFGDASVSLARRCRCRRAVFPASPRASRRRAWWRFHTPTRRFSRRAPSCAGLQTATGVPLQRDRRTLRKLPASACSPGQARRHRRQWWRGWRRARSHRRLCRLASAQASARAVEQRVQRHAAQASRRREDRRLAQLLPSATGAGPRHSPAGPADAEQHAAADQLASRFDGGPRSARRSAAPASARDQGGRRSRPRSPLPSPAPETGSRASAGSREGAHFVVGLRMAAISPRPNTSLASRLDSAALQAAVLVPAVHRDLSATEQMARGEHRHRNRLPMKLWHTTSERSDSRLSPQTPWAAGAAVAQPRAEAPSSPATVSTGVPTSSRIGGSGQPLTATARSAGRATNSSAAAGARPASRQPAPAADRAGRSTRDRQCRRCVRCPAAASLRPDRQCAALPARSRVTAAQSGRSGGLVRFPVNGEMG